MKNTAFVILGFCALALGAIGLVLPIMPTTPFVLVAAICFSHGNPKLYEKLKNSKYFGEFIENYRHKTGVRGSVKLKAILFLWCTLIASAYMAQKPHVTGILLVVGIGVTMHIATLKRKD